MTKKELAELLKDPEVRKALKDADDSGLESLMADIEIGDDDTLETIAKKSSAKMKKLAEHFTKRLSEVEASAVAKAQKPAKDKEDKLINDFSQVNPGMKNKDVIATMQPLYNKGMTLKEAYDKACKIEEIDPVTGVAPVDDDKKAAKKDDDKSKLRSSNKSDVIDDESSNEDDEEDKKDDGPLDIRAAMAKSMNQEEARSGKTPFTA